MSMFMIGVAMVATGMEPTSPPPAAQAAPTSTGRDNRVICRREDQVGTRLAPRVCLTRAQWRERSGELRRAARENMDADSRASGNRTTPAGGD
jgi:hypothetical protein